MSGETLKRPWGSDLIDRHTWDLPSLKFEWLFHRLRGGSGNILEIGCNGGRFLKTLRHHLPNYRYFGCDIDAEALKQVVGTEGLDVCLGDGCRLPFASSSFDCIVVVDYLEHVENTEKALEEIFRVLKPTGKLIAFIPCEGEAFCVYNLHRRLFKTDVKGKTCGHFPLRKDSLFAWLRERGHLVETNGYSYHFFGQLMDFIFFWMVANSKAVSDWWWSKNKYYSKPDSKKTLASRLANGLISIANALAFMESKALWKLRLGAIGWHVTVTKQLTQH